KALDRDFSYCDKTHWGNNDLSNFKKELNRFRKAMTNAWSVEHFRHYMIIVANYDSTNLL
ncbi:hypothetical protein, partial [Enterobacter cloacae complex sp. 4DZ1-17B1]|uniref:hypothetical protein n=1 Tax=Enterobacter cloacae complex sp. 4DZ1-17B1 TaxID=2511991 RepID=UPI001CA552AE